MSSWIVVNFYDATFTEPFVVISIAQGQFALDPNQLLNLPAGGQFANMTLTPGSFSFFTPSQPIPGEGSAQIPVNSDPGVEPSVTVTGFSGDVHLSWPSSNGPQTRQLQPGVPMPLSNFPG